MMASQPDNPPPAKCIIYKVMAQATSNGVSPGMLSILTQWIEIKEAQALKEAEEAKQLKEAEEAQKLEQNPQDICKNYVSLYFCWKLFTNNNSLQ